MTTLYDLDALTVHGYRLRTGDQTSDGGAVTGALVEAEAVMEDELRRLLPLEERTESLFIYPDARVYPNAYPLVSCDTLTIDGRSLLFARADAGPFIGLIELDPVVTPRMTVTYTGGFDADTLPPQLRHALYDLAGAIAQPRVPLPVGATSVSVGDVSVSMSGGGAGVDAYVAGLAERVSQYRNRWAA